MLAVIDHRSPKEVIDKLKTYCEDVLLFKSEDITYNSISGHPDIFMFQDEQGLVVAPNSPKSLIDFLIEHEVCFEYGERKVGSSLKDSTGYNCFTNSKFLIHKDGYTEAYITYRNEEKEFIDVPQAYTRCSMIGIGEKSFLTSDKGIEKVLLQKGFDCFYFSPEDIQIKDHKNGFIGGTCGIYEKTIFFIGNIEKHKDGLKLEEFLNSHGLQVVCLSDELLYDGGGLFFINQ